MKYLHRVRDGETVRDIASRYGVTAYDILRDNGLIIDNIKSGLILLISKREGIRYVVEPFDTLESIATRYGMTADDIRRYNGVENIFLGEVIYLPNSRIQS